MTEKSFDPDTLITHLGRDPERFSGAVNVPVFRVSTVLNPSLDSYEAGGKRRFEKSDMVYGRTGTPTVFALEEAIAKLDGGDDCKAVPSGLAAVASSLLAFLSAGDHVLVSDSVYTPTRNFCVSFLERFGIEIGFFDPMAGEEFASSFRENTRAVFLEAPGSLTFEVQDVPQLARIARTKGAVVIMDNSWATPLYFKPFEHGVDVAVYAGTKYIVGHSDAMLGLIVSRGDHANKIRSTVYTIGHSVSGDDAYLGLRGLRTLSVRLERHQKNALTVANWLADRKEVARVLHPALPGCPGHDLWKRDFRGSSGLFGVVLAEDYPREAIAAFIEGLDLFGIGASWGGYESLAIVAYPEKTRSATKWTAPGPLIRLHIGLENPGDLIDDLERGLARLTRCGG